MDQNYYSLDLSNLFDYIYGFLFGDTLPNALKYSTSFFYDNLIYFKITSIILSAIFISIFIYTVKKFNKVRAKEREDRTALNEKYEGREEDIKDIRWKKVLEHLESNNQNEWRLAIIEADIMLDNLLTEKGYLGESIGDKLKSIDRSDFISLNDAWEAHKVRNNIAHSGSDFILNQKIVRDAVNSYKKVFEEFNYI